MEGKNYLFQAELKSTKQIYISSSKSNKSIIAWFNTNLARYEDDLRDNRTISDIGKIFLSNKDINNWNIIIIEKNLSDFDTKQLQTKTISNIPFKLRLNTALHTSAARKSTPPKEFNIPSKHFAPAKMVNNEQWVDKEAIIKNKGLLINDKKNIVINNNIYYQVINSSKYIIKTI